MTLAEVAWLSQVLCNLGILDAGYFSYSSLCAYHVITARLNTKACTSPGVPNLGYMYPQGYICLSEGVHLRLSVEEQNVFAYNLFPNIYTYIGEYYFQKSLYACC